jgi:hypothetical protein
LNEKTEIGDYISSDGIVHVELRFSFHMDSQHLKLNSYMTNKDNEDIRITGSHTEVTL